MTSFQELRNLALEARKEGATERQERYNRARDEAFEVITDGVTEKIQNAAKEGRFRYPIYRWTNQSRFQPKTESTPTEETDSIPEATQLYFGNDKEGKNGLHIMALMQPVGIPYEEQLVYKLREFFNSGVEKQEDAEQARNNQLRVFLQRRPGNPRQVAIFVSWERSAFPRRQYQQTVPQPTTTPFVKTTQTPRTSYRGGNIPYRGAGVRTAVRGRGGRFVASA